ncbi:DUF359 domain-containing protein [Candidatus Bathyarchaeota archaeon]|nr:DUF359 domain-containing protein [Candidatus Bathyarchaeota archaeon]
MNTLPRTYRLTNTLRVKLKQPLGELVTGSRNEIAKYLSDYIKKNNPLKVFAVGDVATANISKHGIDADIYIVDNKVMRKPILPVPLKTEREIHVKNPPGTITPEAWKVIQDATKETTVTKIVVEGEEDLLVLPMIMNAPQNAIVVYGQPHKGIVIVRITKEKKQEIKSILKAMTM